MIFLNHFECQIKVPKVLKKSFGGSWTTFIGTREPLSFSQESLEGAKWIQMAILCGFTYCHLYLLWGGCGEKALGNHGVSWIMRMERTFSTKKRLHTVETKKQLNQQKMPWLLLKLTHLLKSPLLRLPMWFTELPTFAPFPWRHWKTCGMAYKTHMDTIQYNTTCGMAYITQPNATFRDTTATPQIH